MEVKKVWVAWQNTDLTEGKGFLRNIATCYSRETALRLGRGKDVQGGNCHVTEEVAYHDKTPGKISSWYVPGYIHPESEEDKKKRILREEKEAAIAKASTVLTEEELKALLR